MVVLYFLKCSTSYPPDKHTITNQKEKSYSSDYDRSLGLALCIYSNCPVSVS